MSVAIASTKLHFPPSAWVEIDLKALAHNYVQLKKLAAANMAHNSGLMPIIKADAYGHGMLECAHVLNDQGCRFWGVSNVDEGMRLREAGYKHSILVFESTLQAHAPAIIELDLIPTVCTIEFADALEVLAAKANKPVPIHVKVDTGMGRLGAGEDQALELVLHIQKRCPSLRLEGIYTHFPLADTDRDFTFAQMRRFRDIVYQCENHFITFRYVHAGNSMGLGDYKSELFNLARPGLMLYGLYPSHDLKSKVHLKPVMSVKAQIIFTRTIPKGFGISYGHTFKAPEDMTIAVLPIGYSNGYLRSLSNKAFVLVHGVRCPVIGRVTMDQIIVDVSALRLSGKMPKVSDECVILGSQKEESITADDIAHWASTISYEIVCSLGSRLDRIVLQ